MADDLLASAIDELYGADPDAFMTRRTELVKQARTEAGTAVAKQIGALRKPTRSAYAINMLARADPAALERLHGLGQQWRDAEKSVDARQIRELTKARRRLIDELTRAALDASDETNPSSSVRDEVVSTLTAALSDESVAEEIGRGALVKPARWEGFGFGGPELTLVPSAGAQHEDRPARTGPVGTGPTRSPAARPRLTAADRQAAKEAEEADRRARREQAEREAAQARADALADARRLVDQAEEDLILATDEEQALLDRVHELEQQLTDGRRAVDEARRDVRRAEIAQRRAQDALRKLDRSTPTSTT